MSVFDAGSCSVTACGRVCASRAGHPAFLDQHLDRLYEGAKAIMLDIGLTRQQLTAAIYSTLGGQRDDRRRPRPADGHPRGEGDAVPGPARDDRARDGGDHRRAQGAAAGDVDRGITLFTMHVRRAGPDTLDPKLNAHSKLNDITACIQAYTAGADEALMLDPHGFVATCNSTHFFIVRRRRGLDLIRRTYCLGGITRANVLQMCRARRHRGARDELQPHRRLRRRRGVRHRHVRRRGAGPDRGRPHDRHRRTRPDGPAAAGALQALRRPRRRSARERPGWAAGVSARLAMWSGPRNISTALMRAWENRPDTTVVDEPLYAPLPGRHRHRPPGPRRGASPPRRPTGAPSSTASSRRCRRRRRPLPEADGPPPVPDDMDRGLDRQAHQRAADPRPARGRRAYVRSREQRRRADDIGLPPAGSPCTTTCRLRASRAAGHRRGRLPARPEVLPALALRLVGIAFTSGCCTGRPGRATPTASGRRTGTPRCGPRPASTLTASATCHSRGGRRRSQRSVCPSTTACTPSVSSAEAAVVRVSASASSPWSCRRC